jgi:hypothetical protein
MFLYISYAHFPLPILIFFPQTLLRIVANQLVTSGSWNIQPNSGGLKANKTGSDY